MKLIFIASLILTIMLVEGELQGAPNQDIAVFKQVGGDTIVCPGPYVCFTSPEWAYYSSVWQLYDDYAISYNFGEIGHIAVADTLKELFLFNYVEDEWATPYDGVNYTDTIRSVNFVVNTGDTIQFWHDFDLTYRNDVTPFTFINYIDTLEYIVDLVESGSETVIMNLKTTKLFPADSLGIMMVNLYNGWFNDFGMVGPDGSGQPDTTKELLLRRIVPSNVYNKTVYVRLTPIFHGAFDDRGLWNRSNALGRRSVEYSTYCAGFASIYDSLVVGDTLGRRPSSLIFPKTSNPLAIDAWPNPAVDNVQISFSANNREPASHLLFVGADDGVVYLKQKVQYVSDRNDCIVDVSNLASGQYFIVAVNGAEYLSYKLIQITKH